MSNASPDDIITIRGSGFELAVWPAVGGGLVSARAELGGSSVLLTRPVGRDDLAARDVRRLGSFVMAPFCNRIVGGRFPFAAGEVRVPLNWPADAGVAIHGLSWREPWDIAERASNRLVLTQAIAGAETTYRYDATLTYDLSAGSDRPAAHTTLALTNRSEQPMPFGLGFHPYLRRAPGAELAFGASGTLVPDDRCLPTHWRPLKPEEAADLGRPVEAFSGTDAAFTGWQGTARLTFPDAGAALVLTASATARLLHLYVPATPAGAGTICLEPVSHVIDVGNRPQFARHGGMTEVQPGETLAMTMTWRVETL
jgi:aldose 1-epimerase